MMHVVKDSSFFFIIDSSFFSLLFQSKWQSSWRIRARLKEKTNSKNTIHFYVKYNIHHISLPFKYDRIKRNVKWIQLQNNCEWERRELAFFHFCPIKNFKGNTERSFVFFFLCSLCVHLVQIDCSMFNTANVLYATLIIHTKLTTKLEAKDGLKCN